MRAGAGEEAERAAAEAYDAGAVGLEQRDEGGEVTLLLYLPAERADAVAAALRSALGRDAAVSPAVAVPEIDWSEAWKASLRAIPVSPRLLVRPSFVSRRTAPGQVELVIDPGQAFGTGAHVSTLLALEWIDALADGLNPGAQLLDVGTGTGVLALAALRRGWAAAVALDVDPLATAAARRSALRNALDDRLLVLTGTLAALAPRRFDLVVANLLRSELLPLLDAIAARTDERGRVVLSGLLASERDEIAAALAQRGLRVAGERTRADADGVDWCAWLTTRRPARASEPAAPPACS